MTDAELNFHSFQHNGIWEGHLNITWLDELAYTIVDSDEDEPIAEIQYQCMRNVCLLGSNTLALLKQRLLSEFAARVSCQEELWNLLQQQTINSPPPNAIGDERLFAISFECPWEQEHGVSVLFNSDGIPTRIAGYGDYF